MKKEAITKTEQARKLFDALMDSYDLTEGQLDEAEALFNNNDVDGLKAFTTRIEKLMALSIPQKIKAVKLSLTDFDCVNVGDIVKFNFTDKAIKNLNKNNISCDLAFCTESIPADRVTTDNGKDTATIIEKDSDYIIAISKNSGIEYALTADDFSGTVNGKTYKSCRCCMFGILPFTLYKAVAETSK